MILTRTQVKKIFGADYYDGAILKQRFGYTVFRDKILPLGSIIAFRAGMSVTENLIDQEDSLNNDFIESADAINFCWEIPNLCPLGAISFQRLFNTLIAEMLSKKYLNAPILMKGDDMMVQKEHTGGGVIQPTGKASVSITVSRNNVALGHTGINILAGPKSPAFAYSTHLNDKQVDDFMIEVIKMFYTLVDDLLVGTSKVL